MRSGDDEVGEDIISQDERVGRRRRTHELSNCGVWSPQTKVKLEQFQSTVPVNSMFHHFSFLTCGCKGGRDDGGRFCPGGSEHEAEREFFLEHRLDVHHVQIRDDRPVDDQNLVSFDDACRRRNEGASSVEASLWAVLPFSRANNSASANTREESEPKLIF